MAVETARDVAVTGSNVLSDAGTAITAGRNVGITAATEKNASSSDYSKRSSGLLGGGGLSLTLGTRSQSSAQKQAGDTAAGSVIGSTGGDVVIQAGQTYTQTGSDVLAPQGDIGIQAKKVDITEAREKRSDSSEQKFSQSGVTVALSVPVIEAVQGVTQMASAVQDTRSERAKAMGAAMAAVKASDALAAAKATAQSLSEGKVPGGVSLSVSLGSSQSRSSSTSSGDTGRGSSVAAGGDIAIQATGGGISGETASDLTVRGSSIQSGGDITLKADNRVRLLSSQDTSAQSGSDSSGSAAIGLSVGLGAKSAGLSLTASASRALGHRNGSATTQRDSTVAAGKKLTIDSGGDTDILGATASGETVKAAVGGNLNMASRQDTATFKEDSRNIGFNASIPIPGMSTGTASASLSAGKTALRSDYASTQTTSGIKAGDGGFGVQVQGKTTLDGAVIASSDKAVQEGKNRFSSEGGLERKDIANSAEYSADSVSVGVGISGAKPDSQSGPALNSAGIGTDSGNASSITQAGISGIAGDTSVRSGDVGSGIKPIFDADRARADANAQVVITKEFAPMAANEWGTQADTMALKAQAEGRTEDAAKWAEGGAYRAAGHAVLGGLTGGTAGALGASASSLAAPVLGEVQASLTSGLKNAGLSDEMAKSLAGATVATTAGVAGTVAGGAEAGVMAFNQDANNRQLHPDEKKRIKDLAKGDAQQEARLTAAACALVKCYAEYPEGSVAYNTLKAMADAGSSDAMALERQQLQVQQGLFNYSTQGLLSDKNIDAAKQLNNTYQITTRALGAGQALLGGAGVAGSVTTAPASCATGIGCVANAAVATLSADAAVTGFKQAVSGQPENTYLNQALQGLGLSPEAASYAEFAFGVGAAAKAGSVVNAATATQAANNAAARMAYEDIAKFSAKGLNVTPEVMQTLQAKALIAEYQAAGFNINDAQRYAKGALETGESLPIVRTVQANEDLIKVVPKKFFGDDGVRPFSPYFMTRKEYESISQLKSTEIGQRLGLPAEQSIRGAQFGFDVYSIAPKSGITPKVFTSIVAPVEQGVYKGVGGAEQVIVPNRSLWSTPKLIGTIGGHK